MSTLSAYVMYASLAGGWIGFALVFIARPRQDAPGPDARRAPRAAAGIALQMLAFATVWTFRRRAATPILPDVPLVDVMVALVVVALAAGSVALIMWAIRHLGRQWAVRARLVEKHELITSGPYAVVRHPIYAGMGGMFLVTGLVISHWWAFGAGLVLFAIGTAIRVREEEKLLTESFGEAFVRYRASVPAVVPRLLHRRSP
ncbi:MAG TPA: isoprenylcysteine carboxylmethyltransferase family protein [Candidatus Kapabacteria bacterium]|nr:isoprenylcysteine carboxylmethyltransferase family protein [Candidatus Kapabacteria bacterium]